MSTRTPSSSSKPVKSILKSKPAKRAKISAHSYPKLSSKVEVDPAPLTKWKGKQREKTTVASMSRKQTSVAESQGMPASSFQVVVGSYEKLLYGLEGTMSSSSSSEDISVDLKPIFIFPAHVSCIKAVASSPNGGKWLATGSSDEIVKVWDLKRKKEIGGLMHHEGKHDPRPTLRSYNNVLLHLRFNNGPTISFPFVFAVCVRGWLTLFISCS
jgi:protein MAK11